MRTTVKNWTRMQEVEVTATKAHGNIPALAGLNAYCGPMNLLFHMTAEQARQLADALVAAAEQVEAEQVAA